MHKTGIESHYILKDGKKLQFGYTTGTCAAAAAKAASIMLLTGHTPETVTIMTPKGILLDLEVLEPEMSDNAASCAIRKFSGDDPDVTNGILVYAEASLGSEPGINIDGGLGVGRITKPGLKQPVGEAAINPVPREMIRMAVEEAMEECEHAESINIVISVPEGVEIAKKTFNPRLGIQGGISILGTSGIVEPMSESALLESIELEIRQKKAQGKQRLLVTPGNYGADFAKGVCRIDDPELVKCSNYIGMTIDMAAAEGFKEVFLIGHVGKLVKLAGGIMNTHSKEGDCRAELMAAIALQAGASAELARQILECVTTTEMLRLLHDDELLEPAMQIMGQRIDFYLKKRAHEQLTIGAIVFTEAYGILCMTGPAAEWLEELRKENEDKE